MARGIKLQMTPHQRKLHRQAQQRAWYHRHKAVVNAKWRKRYAEDEDWRTSEQRRGRGKYYRERARVRAMRREELRRVMVERLSFGRMPSAEEYTENDDCTFTREEIMAARGG